MRNIVIHLNKAFEDKETAEDELAFIEQAAVARGWGVSFDIRG